jgi:urea transporter
LGLASLPERLRSATIILFCALSAVLTLAIHQLFVGPALPVLSVPYVITLWIALLSRGPRVNLSWASEARLPAPASRVTEATRTGREELERVA